ncbi:MAG: IS110 family transposase [Epsilonproteobacteria bacterium]|nr:IS110 family transposase [Campylobacterota bacterium]
MDNCIGLDVSKSTINIHIPKSSLDLEIENTNKAIKSLYSKLKKIYKKEIDNLVFIYEPTGSYSYQLTYFCSVKKIKVFMINPKQSHNFAKAIGQRGKSDKVDARMLSVCLHVARNGDVRVPVINPIETEIKELIGYYKFTTRRRVQTNNHLESLIIKDGSLYAIKDLQHEIKKLAIKERDIIEKIIELINSSETLNKKFNDIKSIVGIGNIGAIVLLHLFIKYPEANQREIVSLAGLDPVQRTSGSSIRGKSRISKAGSRLYRGSLFMSAMSAIRFNDEIKVFYDRLKENGKHTTVAQVAIIKKLIIIARSLYKNDCSYDVEFYKKQSGKNEKMALSA